ncbi:MAG: transposase [Smithellaceae bacterium]|nr:transposase [Smithellaceae bacterium]
MGNYRRVYRPGGCYFFTVVTHGRQGILNHPDVLERLRSAFRHVRTTRPFTIDAIVVLPDHLHCLWRLPLNDHDFSIRWRLIKHYVSTGIAAPINYRHEKAFWQRRFWEHLIRNEEDWRRHMDYIHYNPVKHGYTKNVSEWPYSSFRRAVKDGLYAPDWGSRELEELIKIEIE